MLRAPLAIALVVALTPSPIAATSTTAGAYVGDGWVLFSLDHTDTTRVVLTGDDMKSSMIGVTFLRSDGVPLVSSRAWVDGIDYHVSVDPPNGIAASVGPVDRPLSSGDFGIDGRLTTQPFEGYLLLWAAGRLDGISWSVTGGSIQRLASGSGSWYSQGEGFESDSHVIVGTPSASVHLQEAGRYPFSVSGRFIGIVGHTSKGYPVDVSYGTQSFQLATPSGTVPCTCSFTAFEGRESGGPGQYVLERSAQRFEGNAATLVIAGVDVAWPPP